MSGHNTLVPGRVIIFAEWTGSEYVEHPAYVRAIVGDNTNTDHVEVNLSYNSGVGAATPANNVKNIEQLTTDEDYWRWMHQPDLQHSQPFGNTRPLQGEIIWIGVYDPAEGEYYHYLAFVRAIPGPPQDQEPPVNCSYYDSAIDDTVNANVVKPFTEAATDENYWADVLAP